MQFKRRRVSLGTCFVNSGILAALFFLAACSPGPVREAEEGPTTPAVAGTSTAITLPAVWSTGPLDRDVADIALAGEASSLLAVAYAGRGVQMFDLEAERVSETVGIAIRDLANGQRAEIDGSALTVFPAITDEGALIALVFGEGLVAPVEIALPIATGGSAAGLCSHPADEASPALMKLAYWTGGARARLVEGELGIEGETFTWQETSSDLVEPAPSTCVFTRDGNATAADAEVADIAVLEHNGARADVVLTQSGTLAALSSEGTETPIALREGLTVQVPVRPRAIAGLGRPWSGGYPGGLIVLAGETRPGEYQAVFVDASPLTSADAE